MLGFVQEKTQYFVARHRSLFLLQKIPHDNSAQLAVPKSVVGFLNI